MICRLSDCEHYRLVYEDDDDDNGEPYCALAEYWLPDGIFWPYDCVAEKKEDGTQH